MKLCTYRDKIQDGKIPGIKGVITKFKSSFKFIY